MREHDKVLADFNTVLKYDRNDPRTLQGRGLARYRKGDTKGGRADMAAAKALEPNIEQICSDYGIKD